MKIQSSKPKNRKIKNQLIFFFLFLTLTPLITFGWLSMQSTKETLWDSTQFQQTNTASALRSEITHFMESNFDRLDNITHNINAQLEATNSEIVTEFGTRKIFYDFLRKSNNIEMISTQGLNSSSRPNLSQETYDYNKEDELKEYYKIALEEASKGNNYLSPPVMSKSINVPVSLYTVPLMPNNKPTGMVAAVLNLDPVRRAISSTASENYEIFLIQQDGKIISTANMIYIHQDSDLMANPLVIGYLKALASNTLSRVSVTQRFIVKTLSGEEEYLGTSSVLEKLNWGLFVQLKLSVAFALVDAMMRKTILMLAIASIFAIIAGVYLANSITKPVRQLTEASEILAERRFDQPIAIPSRNELGLLAERFNIMSSEIQRYIKDLQTSAERNKSLFFSSIRMISAAVDEKDPYTRGHSEKVREYSVEIAQLMGLSQEEIEKIAISAILHDVGKIGVNDKVLNKAGKLTPEEFEEMKQHPEKGAYILSPIHELSDIIPGILYHHEKWDGTGYPRGLSGESIPLIARIIAVADTFDAMTSDRPYQKAMDPDYVFKLLFDWGGKRYDPQVIASLFKAYEEGRIQLSKSRSSILR